MNKTIEKIVRWLFADELKRQWREAQSVIDRAERVRAEAENLRWIVEEFPYHISESVEAGADGLGAYLVMSFKFTSQGYVSRTKAVKRAVVFLPELSELPTQEDFNVALKRARKTALSKVSEYLLENRICEISGIYRGNADMNEIYAGPIEAE